MDRERGQATVEWAALVLLVAVALAAVAAASHAVRADWLPRRLSCGLLGADCAPGGGGRQRVVIAGRLHVPTETHLSVPGPVLGVVTAPVAPVASLLGRHAKTIRKVVVGTAVVAGVAATCAAAVAAAKALGVIACGSSIITGGYSVYNQATN